MIPEGGAVNVLAQQDLRAPGFPLILPGIAVGLDHPSGRGEQQGEGQIGRGFGQHVRGVADHDAPAGVASPMSMLSKPTARLLTTFRFGAAASRFASMRSVSRGQQPVRGFGFFQDQLVRRRQFLGPDLHVRDPVDLFEGFGRDFTADVLPWDVPFSLLAT